MPGVVQSQSTGEAEAAAETTDSGTRRLAWRKPWIGSGISLLPDRRVRAECACRNPHGELQTEAEEIVLDVRELPMTGQSGRTLAMLEELSPGQRLRHVNSLIPWQLFPMLETRGYRYRVVGRKEGHIHVLIWPLTDSRHV